MNIISLKWRNIVSELLADSQEYLEETQALFYPGINCSGFVWGKQPGKESCLKSG